MDTQAIMKMKSQGEEQPGPRVRITWRNFYQHLHWDRIFCFIVVPLVGFISTAWVPLQWKTALWSTIYFLVTEIGITAGYHRLWSHRSYTASLPLRAFLALVGAGATLGSIWFWSTTHRFHHRYTDTDLDPYTVNRGLLNAHILWALVKQNRGGGYIETSDLENDPVVRLQYKYYNELMVLMSWVLPMSVAGFAWGDWAGGLLYAGIIRTFFVQQSMFCLNSFAHYLGDQPYSDKHTPRDNLLVAILTCGEGYHNFHEFPVDYRNGIEWYHLDPSKWAIYAWSRLGLASNLKTFKYNEIEKGKIQQLRKQLDVRAKELDWGTPLEELHQIDWNEFQRKVNNEGKLWMAIEGVVHDVGAFMEEHPGGAKLLKAYVGKDATAKFNGGIYDHSNGARNLMAGMRIAKLTGGGEVEILK